MSDPTPTPKPSSEVLGVFFWAIETATDTPGQFAAVHQHVAGLLGEGELLWLKVKQLNATGYVKLGIIEHMKKQDRKPLKWIASAKRDLDEMPEEVKDLFGHAIDVAQTGAKHQDAKVLTGFGSAGVLEVVEDHNGDTYRAVYTVKFSGWVYVLHCFQKKSKSGIATPKQDLELIASRLKAAQKDYESWKAQQGVRK